ncbi:unnamed protein product [Pleuronectes platessa]|uniref:Uncharacterized protein n=1 Tax=Pleuronectes platessa TaxID=8262 RepID=A0A9N7TTS0_PLEPL|nr:unnamed protein product [Pleuronectes platessa]
MAPLYRTPRVSPQLQRPKHHRRGEGHVRPCQADFGGVLCAKTRRGDAESGGRKKKNIRKLPEADREPEEPAGGGGGEEEEEEEAGDGASQPSARCRMNFPRWVGNPSKEQVEKEKRERERQGGDDSGGRPQLLRDSEEHTSFRKRERERGREKEGGREGGGQGYHFSEKSSSTLPGERRRRRRVMVTEEERKARCAAGRREVKRGEVMT